MRKLLFIMMIIVAALAAAPRPAGASCMRVAPEKSFAAADVVFVGRVTDRINQMVQFKVDQYWKGDVSLQYTVRAGAESLSFRRGYSYLVYATRKDPRQAYGEIRPCSGTVRLRNETAKGLEALGPGKIPQS